MNRPCISFTVEIGKDTYHNVLETEEFVVNIASFDREILEKVRVVGLPFAGINELESWLDRVPGRA
jgi:flavin reductase (DIM6/NTAB) family NADH-FMN oxidoreductase RutF